jgi:hypothetical protein
MPPIKAAHRNWTSRRYPTLRLISCIERRCLRAEGRSRCSERLDERNCFSRPPPKGLFGCPCEAARGHLQPKHTQHGRLRRTCQWLVFARVQRSRRAAWCHDAALRPSAQWRTRAETRGLPVGSSWHRGWHGPPAAASRLPAEDTTERRGASAPTESSAAQTRKAAVSLFCKVTINQVHAPALPRERASSASSSLTSPRSSVSYCPCQPTWWFRP